MIKERHHEKLTKNERRTLDYIISKAEFEHSLTVEITPTELMEELQFNSLKTAYNNIKKLIEKKLITKLADELSLDANKFVFQKDAQDKEVLTLRYMLQELQTERDVFPFLEPQNRLEYFKTISARREEAYKIDYQLTKDICKLADAGIYEFPLKPIKGKDSATVPFCLGVIATYDKEKTKTFKTYEDRELKQAIDYLKTNPEHYEEIASEYSDYPNDYIKHLFDEYVTTADDTHTK